jgi:hypothetical protein
VNAASKNYEQRLKFFLIRLRGKRLKFRPSNGFLCKPSVVICAHNPRLDYLRRVLEALQARTSHKCIGAVPKLIRGF